MADSPEGSPTYDTDFRQWAREQARLVWEYGAAVPGLDVPNVVEELETLAREECQKAEDAAEQYVAGHLAVPTGREMGLPRSLLERWETLLWEGHWYLKRILKNSPSVGPEIEAEMADINDQGRNQAVLWFSRCGLEPPDFPEPMYTLEQLLEHPVTRRKRGEW